MLARRVFNSSRAGVPGLSFIGDDDDRLRFSVTHGDWHFVARGDLPVDPNPPPRAAPRAETILDSRRWTATASVPDSTFFLKDCDAPIDASAANAIDGDPWTGWRNMAALQQPGQWFQLDMKQRQSFNKIVLDNTWALWDSPQKYAVSVCDDGANWGSPIAVGEGQLGISTITFPPQTARWVRITQTGTNPTYRWSIFELDVYGVTP